MPNLSIISLASLSRRTTLWVVCWVFGLATTTLLIGLWGRAVATDEAALRASLRAAVDTDSVAAQMQDWLVRSTAAGSGSDPAELAAVLGDVGSTEATEQAIGTLVDRTVDAALAPPGTASTIDLAAALQPVGVEMARRLSAAGVDVDPEAVTATLARLEPLVVAADYGDGIAGAAVAARSVLTTVAVVASLMLLGSGAAATLLAEDRPVMLRTLVSRIAVSAFTFVIVTRIAAWALDPSGGRSPAAAGGAVLLRSNGGLLLVIAVASLAAGTALRVTTVRRRLGTPEEAVVEVEEDPTAERMLVRV